MFGDVARRAERIECSGLGIGIVCRNLFRPNPELAAIEVEGWAITTRGSRHHALIHAAVRDFFRDLRLSVIKGIGPAVPLACDIAVTVERDQSARTRLQPEARHQREITAG